MGLGEKGQNPTHYPTPKGRNN